MLVHVKRNAIAYAALFVALGGTSYAAVRLPAGSVGSTELHRGAVTKTKLHRGAVTSAAVQDHTLKTVDFARGQLTAGPNGDKGDKGDAGPKGDKGDPGPTFGSAGIDTGCCAPLPVTTGTPEATKKVTLTTRSRLFVFGNVYAGILNCATPYCSFPWVLRVDGEELPNSARRVRANSGESSSSQLMPFGVTEPLEPGTHTITLVRGPLNGTAAMSHGDFDLGAIALGV